MKLAGLLLITIILVCTGCSGRWDKNPQSDAPSSAIEAQLRAQSGPAPSYATVRAKVLGPRCIVCHQASSPQNAGILLEDYASTRSRLAQIQDAVFKDKTMPRGMTLSGDEAALLAAWIRAGAPELSDAAPEAPGPAPQPQPPAANIPERFRWPGVQTVVFKKSCASCHDYDAPMAREGVDALIKRALVKKDMPPQGGGDPLTEEQLETLTQWIRYGMPD